MNIAVVVAKEIDVESGLRPLHDPTAIFGDQESGHSREGLILTLQWDVITIVITPWRCW